MRQQGLERNDWRKQQIFRYDTSYNAFMRIHSLSCGCFCPLGSRLIHGQGSLFKRACLICRCLLVETRRGLVLIDTGLGHADHQQFRLWKNLPARLLMAPKLDPSLFAVNQIRSLGFDPQDVRHIICTHLDHDHAGGLADFPDAMVHLSDAEHHAATCGDCRIHTIRYHAHQIAHQPRWVKHPPQGEAWMGFENVRAIDGLEDELLLIPLVGHSAGHCGVAIRTQTGWLFHVGDAIMHHGELQQPEQCPWLLQKFRRLVAEDFGMLMDNRLRLAELAARGDVSITNSHDKFMVVTESVQPEQSF
jgi:glyoxylase-like metal-dependent hydrolase (beta-lactamase superfamily II)